MQLCVSEAEKLKSENENKNSLFVAIQRTFSFFPFWKKGRTADPHPGKSGQLLIFKNNFAALKKRNIYCFRNPKNKKK